MIDRSKYPELAKLDDLHTQKLVVTDFLEWLNENRIGLASVIQGSGHDRWAPITEGHESLMARYFGLDLNAIERERRAMLAAHVATTQPAKYSAYESMPQEWKPSDENGVSVVGQQTETQETPMDSGKAAPAR